VVSERPSSRVPVQSRRAIFIQAPLCIFPVFSVVALNPSSRSTMAVSSNNPSAAAADFDMRAYFLRDVGDFISSSTEPKWNEFLSLVDQLIVCSNGRSSLFLFLCMSRLPPLIAGSRSGWFRSSTPQRKITTKTSCSNSSTRKYRCRISNPISAPFLLTSRCYTTILSAF
jgi:hypothetical protein